MFEKVLTPDEILRQGGIDTSLLNIPTPIKTEDVQNKTSNIELPTINNNSKVNVNSMSDSELELLINQAKEALLLRNYKSINVKLLEAVDGVVKQAAPGQKILVLQSLNVENNARVIFNTLSLNPTLSTGTTAVYSQHNSNVHVLITTDKNALEFFKNPQDYINSIIESMQQTTQEIAENINEEASDVIP